MSSVVLTPKRHLLARKDVVWAIKRKNRSSGTTLRVIEKKDKTVKSREVAKVIFRLVEEKSPPNRFASKFAWWFRSPTNHVCKVWDWNFQGLRFYRGSNISVFLLILAWALQQCSANALPVIKLWTQYVYCIAYSTHVCHCLTWGHRWICML